MNELQIFVEARSRNDPTDRQEYLRDATRGNDELLTRIERLLFFDESGDTFLDRNPNSLLGKLYSSVDSLPESMTTRELVQKACARISSSHGDGEDPATDDLGNLLHYRLLEPIGHGGFGVVVKALDEKLRRVVAIKLLHPHLANHPPARNRFLREARSVAAIRNDNTVQIYAVEEQPVPFLVMEYIDGDTLQNHIDQHAPLPVDEVLRLGIQISKGLAAAHRRGIIHRDIKPANILLQQEPVCRAKVSDFGLALMTDQEKIDIEEVAGTPIYMSPEQASGDRTTPAADLFSLGAVLYAMWFGRPPQHPSNSESAAHQHADRETEMRPRRNRPDSRTLLKIISKLLETEPDHRYQSAEQVADELQSCLDRKPKFVRGLPAAGIAALGTIGAVVLLSVLMNSVFTSSAPRDLPPGPRPADDVVANGRLTPREQSASEQATAVSTSGMTHRLNMERPADVDGKVQLEQFLRQMSELNPGFPIADVEPEFDGDRLAGLECVWAQNLSPLSRLSFLRSLRIWSQSSHELSLGFATGIPGLRQLRADGMLIQSLEPLKDLSLNDLSLWGWNADGNPALGDLSPLEDQPITYLNIGNSTLTDLSPLKGMPLQFLCLNMTPVEDLSPISNAPINKLLLSYTDVSDLTPLKTMPLKNLEIGASRVTDLSPLEGSAIESLYIDDLPIEDLSPLQQMPNLKELRIAFDEQRNKQLRALIPNVKLIHNVHRFQSELSDGKRHNAVFSILCGLTPGRDSDIERVLRDLLRLNSTADMSECAFESRSDAIVKLDIGTLEDYSPLARLTDLEQLRILDDNRRAVDLKFVSELTKLKTLRADHCRVDDLTPLKELDLTELSLWSCGLSDNLHGTNTLRQLKGLKLNYLNCGDSWVQDLSPLSGMPLEFLCVSYSEVADLRPLRGMPLKKLLLAKTKVSDLSPLEGMPIEHLEISETNVTDLSPIAGMQIKILRVAGLQHLDRKVIDSLPLEELTIDGLSQDDQAWIRSMSNLKRLNGQPVETFLEQ